MTETNTVHRLATGAEAFGGPDRVLSPRSIAMVGASNNIASIGGQVFANLARAFSGPLHPVHPKDTAVQDRPAFPSIGEVPDAVDLAVVVVPAPAVPSVIEADVNPVRVASGVAVAADALIVLREQRVTEPGATRA